MNEIVSSILIFWVLMGIPSMAYGIVLARRSGQSLVLAVIACLLLPWLGCLFFTGQPAGDTRMGGIAYYSTSMLGITALMAAISIFLPWVSGDPEVLGAESYSPWDVRVFAVLIGLWVIALIAGIVVTNHNASMVAGVLLGIAVSAAAGVLAALVQLWGQAGVFVPELRDAQVEQYVEVDRGGWLALVALIVAYVSVTLLPFGLLFTRREPQQPPMVQPDPAAAPPSAPWPPQQPEPQQPQFPSSSGAGW